MSMTISERIKVMMETVETGEQIGGDLGAKEVSSKEVAMGISCESKEVWEQQRQCRDPAAEMRRAVGGLV